MKLSTDRYDRPAIIETSTRAAITYHREHTDPHAPEWNKLSHVSQAAFMAYIATAVDTALAEMEKADAHR